MDNEFSCGYPRKLIPFNHYLSKYLLYFFQTFLTCYLILYVASHFLKVGKEIFLAYPASFLLRPVEPNHYPNSKNILSWGILWILHI